MQDRLQRLIGASLTAPTITARHLWIVPFRVKQLFRHVGNIGHVPQEFVEHLDLVLQCIRTDLREYSIQNPMDF
ncbi:MAG: hypothetical protein QOJ15_8332 [Bradyrhizobium sp.]|jgi:hypothetical protein|nr:hypothetical protein [Bradyrhizobium sp.]